MSRLIVLCLFLFIPTLSAAVITGGDTTYIVAEGDNLLLISAKLGVEVKSMVRQNALDLTKRLKPGQALRVNNRKIAPRTAENGIVIDIPGRMLCYFKGGKLVMTFPVGLGMPMLQGARYWHTPSGLFFITGKDKNPTWYVPESIQEQMKLQGKPVLTTMPPGPNNPLGRYALYTSIKGIAIHETIWPTTVYRFRSHGCIRVLSQNMEQLFDEVEAGTPGEIVYEPVKAAVTEEGRVFLEVDPDVYGKVKDLLKETKKRIEELRVSSRVDWTKVETMVKEQSGNAEEITASGIPLTDTIVLDR